MICDLAETYQIFDYKSLPVDLVATFSVGLREDSRVFQKITERPYLSWNERILSYIFDEIRMLHWGMTENGRNNIDRPASLHDILFGNEKNDKETVSFNNGDDFKEAWRNIINGNNNC